MSASSMWDRFIDIVKVGIAMHVPFDKIGGSEHRHIHYPLRIKELLRNNVSCWHLYKAFPMDSVYGKYKRASKACSSAIKL
jgi:hypothetical protein